MSRGLRSAAVGWAERRGRTKPSSSLASSSGGLMKSKTALDMESDSTGWLIGSGANAGSAAGDGGTYWYVPNAAAEFRSLRVNSAPSAGIREIDGFRAFGSAAARDAVRAGAGVSVPVAAAVARAVNAPVTVVASIAEL